MYQYLIPFYWWTILHFTGVPLFINPFTRRWTFGMFPCLGCYEYCSYKLHIQVLVGTCVSFFFLSFFLKKSSFFKDFIYSFLGRGEEREKERERNINVSLPLDCPILGTWPATQACALTGNWTDDPLVRSLHSVHWATPARAHFSWVHTEVVLAGLYGNCMFNFEALPNCPLKWRHHFTFPPALHEGRGVHILASTYLSFFFIVPILVSMRRHLMWFYDLDLHFPSAS